MNNNFLEDHSPAVYWFWHSIPSQEEISRQLDEMHRVGIRTFYIQARLGMPMSDYLSDSYLTAYRSAIQRAQNLGMHAGLYDDYNWDSGQAGGRTVTLDAAAREQHLFWSEGKIIKAHCELLISNIHSAMYSGMGEAILSWIYDNGRAIWGDWHIFKALAFRDKALLDFDTDVVDVTAFSRVQGAGDCGSIIYIEIPPTINLDGYKVVTYVYARCLSSRLINYLSNEAVRSFIRAGYDPYRAALSEYFGNTIHSIFFDHPYGGFYVWQEQLGQIGNSLMFTPEFPNLFYQQRGYALEKALLAFLRDLGPQTPKLRMDFFETYGKVARKSFFGALNKWAHQNNLLVSGHELLAHVGSWDYKEGFSFVDARTNFGADYFSIDAYRDRTAADACNYEAQLSAKLGDSAAKAHGRHGCAIEQYSVAKTSGVPSAAGQWELTLNELRAQAIRHALMGASQLIFHAYYQTDGNDSDPTLHRNARFDFPPGINFEPWFAQYPKFSGQIEALTDLIQSSQPVPSIAILFPLRTWWAEDSHSTFSNESAQWLRFLFERGFNFDIISEEQLEQAKVKAGKLMIGKETYPLLIFPAISALKSTSILQKVAEFIQDRGYFIATGCLPISTQESGSDKKLQDGFREVIRSGLHARYFDSLPEEATFREFCEGTEINELRLSRKISLKLWSWEGRRGSDRLLVVFNDGQEKQRLSIECANPSVFPFRIDLSTGAEKPWPWFEHSKKHMKVFVDVSANELVALAFKRSWMNQLVLVDSTLVVNDIDVKNASGVVDFYFSDASNGGRIILESKSKPKCSAEPATPLGFSQLGTKRWQILVSSHELLPAIPIKGWRLTLGDLLVDKPIDVEQGWETQGGEDYAGKGIYHAYFDLTKPPEPETLRLTLPRVETTASLQLNGHSLGEIGWPPYVWILPTPLLYVGRNQLEITVWSTAANHYYAGTSFQPHGKTPCGLLGTPRIEYCLPIVIHCTKD